MAAAPKWRPLLGPELAKRVAAVSDGDPAAFCRHAVEVAVRLAESTAASTTKEQRKCPHPEKDRSYGRCRACGFRGLPEITRSKAATP